MTTDELVRELSRNNDELHQSERALKAALATAQKRIAELEADLNNEMQWATHYCEEMTKAQAELAAALRREEEGK